MNALHPTLSPALCAALAFGASTAIAQDTAFAPTGKRWVDMDYGPFASMTLEVGEGNIAYKGIAIRLDGESDIARGSEFAVFDTDTLRWAAGWIGDGFVDWRNVAYDGSHNTHCKIVGAKVFENTAGPGWAKPATESFADDARTVGTDGKRYGPLPRTHAHWQGLYLAGRDVVLSYTVGDTAVLERMRTSGSSPHLLVRDLDLGPRQQDLWLRVAHDAEAELEIRPGDERSLAIQRRSETSEPAPEPGVFDGTFCYELDREDSRALDFRSSFTVLARIRTTAGGTILAKAPASGRWAPDGTTLFVRDGRLGYDVGWVGVVSSRERVDDGAWHAVAVTFDADAGVTRLWVDGELAGEKELAPQDRASEHVVRIGFTSPNFPNPSAFVGEIDRVQITEGAMSADQIRAAATGVFVVSLFPLADWSPSEGGDSLADRSEHDRVASRVKIEAAAAAAARFVGPYGTVGLVGTNASLVAADDGSLLLRIPAGDERARITLQYGRFEASDSIGSAEAALRDAPNPADLAARARSARATPWSERPTTTQSTLGPDNGPFVVTAIPTPEENAYRSWMRLGGFDFFEDATRAAVCTWMGEVWTVDGLDGTEFTWTRIATGLFQPLGLVVRDDEIFVLGRDQITWLRDLDGDGTVDFYENFNNDAQVTEHFHEFAMDLQTDADGTFYYTKGGRHAKKAVVPQHGTLLRVTPDGASTERIAFGFRAPNGLALLPDDTFAVSDQEGHWTPANRINIVQRSGFYGYRWGWFEDEAPASFDEPLVWVDHDIDRSPAEQVLVTERSWGSLHGELLSLSYGTGKILLVLRDEVDGHVQGAVTKLPLPEFPTGIHRARFHPDGRMYLCGLFGWSSDRTAPGGLFRIERTEAPLCVPIAAHATERGIVLHFSEPLDVRRAGRAGRYQVTRWNYEYRQQYGSDDFRVSDGKKGREEMTVTGVTVADDGSAVLLELEDMRPCDQLRIELRLASVEGERVSEPIYLTVHALASADARLGAFGR